HPPPTQKGDQNMVTDEHVRVGRGTVPNACFFRPRDWQATASSASRLPLVIARYSRPAMAKIWSDEGKFARWVDVELAALEGWAEAGVVPADAVAEIAAGAVPPSRERV